MILLFAILLSLVGLLIRWKKNLFFQLIDHNEKNERFIIHYAYQLIGLGLIGIALHFFETEVLAMFYIASVLLVSGVFSFAFAKKMSD